MHVLPQASQTSLVTNQVVAGCEKLLFAALLDQIIKLLQTSPKPSKNIACKKYPPFRNRQKQFLAELQAEEWTERYYKSKFRKVS